MTPERATEDLEIYLKRTREEDPPDSTIVVTVGFLRAIKMALKRAAEERRDDSQEIVAFEFPGKGTVRLKVHLDDGGR